MKKIIKQHIKISIKKTNNPADPFILDIEDCPEKAVGRRRKNHFMFLENLDCENESNFDEIIE